MTDLERGRRVGELVDAALNREARDRTGFVAAACGSDRLDLGGLLTLLARSVAGDPRCWRVARVPTDQDEDGRWIAYQSDESGRTQVVVRPFPSVIDRRRQVSTDGGSEPKWSADGRGSSIDAAPPS